MKTNERYEKSENAEIARLRDSLDALRKILFSDGGLDPETVEWDVVKAASDLIDAMWDNNMTQVVAEAFPHKFARWMHARSMYRAAVAAEKEIDGALGIPGARISLFATNTQW